MLVVTGSSANLVYLELIGSALRAERAATPSRLGDVLDLGPACWELVAPGQRLIFVEQRRLNPVFAVVEAAWVLAGRNDVKPLAECIRDYGRYSDDGATLYGAYGYRLREKFGRDQIEEAISELGAMPSSRRAVLTLFAPDDLNRSSADIPCNTAVFLKRREQFLDITVINRSSDLYLGVPYDVFTFHALHAMLAQALSVEVGVQRHFTNCLHVYVKDLNRVRLIHTANNVANIHALEQALKPCRVASIIRWRNEIVDGNYDEVGDDALVGLLQGHRAYKKEMDLEELTRLPSDEVLGYMAQRWLRSP